MAGFLSSILRLIVYALAIGVATYHKHKIMQLTRFGIGEVRYWQYWIFFFAVLTLVLRHLFTLVTFGIPISLKRETPHLISSAAILISCFFILVRNEFLPYVICLGLLSLSIYSVVSTIQDLISKGNIKKGLAKEMTLNEPHL